MKRLVTGFQPTGAGELHIGNYCGVLYDIQMALKKKMFDTKNIFIFVADLHSMTVYSRDLRNKSFNMAKNLCAIMGNDIKIYIQSDLNHICSGLWFLSMFATSGEMNRMTQFKDKKDLGNSNIGLYTYPILMAADVLFMNAEFVPVGEDQQQHLEEIRNIATRANQYSPNMFILPSQFTTKQYRIMSLNDITKKMSKSYPDGCLFLNDPQEVIQQKISKAQTDNDLFPSTIDNLMTRPAAYNLALIYSIFSQTSLEEIVAKYVNYTWRDFKQVLTTVITEFCLSFQAKYAAIDDTLFSTQLHKTAEDINKNILHPKIQEAYKFFMC